MKTELHLKIISIIIAFSLLFLGLYNQQPVLAETIRILISLVIIIYFIIIWMRTKKFLYFVGSMLLPIWLLMLTHPGSMTDYLLILEKEESLREIAQFIQDNAQYKKQTTYSILDLNNAYQVVHTTSSTNLNLSIPTVIKKWHKIPSLTLQQLLRKSHLIAFQLEQGSILFHINNHRLLRYYFEKDNFIYQGDKEIKSPWYSVSSL